MTGPGDANPFLDPILARWRREPAASFAILADGDEWTHHSLDAVMRRASSVSDRLSRTGIAPGDIVMLILRPGIDCYAAFLGTMLGGAVPSFLPYPSVKQDPSLYWRQHKAVFAGVRPAAVVVYDALADDVACCAEGSGARIVRLSSLDADAAAGDPEPRTPPPADGICLLQHSSGTTGLKKGVALSYRAVARQLARYRDALRLDHADVRIATWLPLYHDMGLISSFLLPAWLGIPIIGLDPFAWVADPGSLLEAMERHRATHAWLPNFAFQHMARRVRRGRVFDLSAVRALISCSEPCKPAAFDAFAERFREDGIRPSMLLTCYAMAETVFAVSQSPPGEAARRVAVDRNRIAPGDAVRNAPTGEEPLVLLSNGPPIADCSVRIRHDNETLDERRVGEICVAAPFLMDGYFNNDAATRAAMQQGFYRTGDLGFLDDGEVFVVGRLKDVIIVNGKNVFAHDVEAAVSGVAGVKPGRCVAFGIYSARIGSEQLVVVAEHDPGPDETRTPEALVSAINNAVVDETGVTCGDIRLVSPGWLAKTTSGKTSRSENASRYRQLLADAAERRVTVAAEGA